MAAQMLCPVRMAKASHMTIFCEAVDRVRIIAGSRRQKHLFAGRRQVRHGQRRLRLHRFLRGRRIENRVAEPVVEFRDAVLNPRPPKEPVKPKPPLTMADLPPACKQVLLAP